MNEIKAVTKYLTSDGVEWDNEEKALERQAVINFNEDYGKSIDTLIHMDWSVDAEDMSAWILKNRGAVLTLLGYEDMI